MSNTIEQVTKALDALRVYPFRSRWSSRPDYEAQEVLSGRTHYVDAQTLRYFKARILRTFVASNNLFYVIQETLPHPDYGWQRVRRNVVFDVFGDVITESRETIHTNGKKADRHFDELIGYTKSAEALDALAEKITKCAERRKEDAERAAEAMTTV